MKKIIGLFDATANDKLPFLTQLSVIYEEDGKYFIQYQLSKQFFALTTIVCDLQTKDEIENEVQTYLSQGISTINSRFGNYTNNEDIPGNKYYFKEVNPDIITSHSFYPITTFNTYIDEDLKINEENPVYAIIVGGTDTFIGNREYTYKQIAMLLEYPTDEDECDFKVNMLYDLEKYDALSEEVEQSSKTFITSKHKDEWNKKKEEGQKLKLVYQKINHNC